MSDSAAASVEARADIESLEPSLDVWSSDVRAEVSTCGEFSAGLVESLFVAELTPGVAACSGLVQELVAANNERNTQASRARCRREASGGLRRSMGVDFTG